jgi:oligoendopeptidase F
LNEQTIYKLLRELDSTILEKFGFGSCNLSQKAQVSFMIGFISLISSFCKDVESISKFSAIEIAEMEEEDELIDLQEKLSEDFKVDYRDLVGKSKEELSEMLRLKRSSNSRKNINHT